MKREILEKLKKLEKKKKSLHEKKERRKFWFVPGLLYILCFASGLWLWNTNQGNEILNRIRIRWLSEIVAQESKKTAGNKKNEKKEEQAKLPASDKRKENQKASTKSVIEDYNYLSTLNERRRELDQRERELGELEEELNKQKIEIEGRIKDLKSIRIQIRKLLEERIELEEDKVKKLVEFYSNMKPQQAAKVMETIDEDLSVAILGRMKQKNAADILNLLQPEKARRLSEMYAGYEKKKKDSKKQ